MSKEKGEIQKLDVINAVLSYLMKKEYTSITAQKANFKEPPLVKGSNQNKTIQPDLAANLAGNTHLFEIETEPDTYDDKETITKWESLSSYASKHGGELHLILFDKDQHKVSETVKQYKIEADILQVTFK